MRKLFNIAKGWFIFLFYKRSEKAKMRLEICFECPERRGIVCGYCTCPLYPKAESDDDCPLNKWPKETPSQSPTS